MEFKNVTAFTPAPDTVALKIEIKYFIDSRSISLITKLSRTVNIEKRTQLKISNSHSMDEHRRYRLNLIKSFSSDFHSFLIVHY